MTCRLYYDNAYLTQFTARVLECEKGEKGYKVRLDQSAFYPTSGGQPYDTGVLGDRNILDVWVEENEVFHLTDGPLEVGSQVEGRIDWPRRFDHMQQHAGEHLLAGAVYHQLQGNTIGLHLGADFSTIDVELPGGRMRVEEEELMALEDTVNRHIQMDLPVKCYFPTPEELKNAPLRKPPTVSEHIRLVQMGDVECVACGGTHPSSTGQIGLLKILDARPSRGKMRLSFVCGMRAVRDYRMRFEAAGQAAEKLSTQVALLPQGVEKALEKLKQAEYELRQAVLQNALNKVDALEEKALRLPGGQRAVSQVIPGAGREALREVATALTAKGVCALLAEGQDGGAVVFAAPEGFPQDMGKLLSWVLKPLGGKGGGKADFAQGAGPGGAALEKAMEILQSGI